MGLAVVAVSAAATVGLVVVIGIVVVTAVAAAVVVAVGSGPHRCGGTLLVQGSPIPDWSYSHRSSRGRVPRVDATCRRAWHTPAQAFP
jgi:hypothetical protein